MAVASSSSLFEAADGQELCHLLERHGWTLVRIHESHHIYGKSGERARLSAPVHGNRRLKLGLQRHPAEARRD